MRMLLEMDDELTERPELWTVHGTRYLPATFSSKKLDKMVEVFNAASPTDKSAAALTIANALSAHPTATQAAELRQLAFASRCFNFFEIVDPANPIRDECH
jgi:hypothetical protein